MNQRIPATRVVQIIDRLNIGGPTPHVLQVTRGLRDLGYTAHLTRGRVAPGESEMVDAIHASGIDPIDIPGLGRSISLWNDLNAFRALYTLMREKRPDLVHTHKSKAGALGRLAARLAGVPVIVHSFHGHPFHSYFSDWKSRLIVTVERLLAHTTDAIIAVSKHQRAELLHYRIAPRSRVHAIPLGFDLTAFLSRQARDDTFRWEIGCPSDVPLIGMVGRLVPIKAVDVFLNAARAVTDEVKKARFVIVGDGECRDELEALAEKLGLTERVAFVGFRQDVDQIYAALDLTVLSSYNEGLPVSLIEAIASGCYVVSTDVGGVVDLVNDEQIGRTVPPGKPDVLARAIIEALQKKPRVSEDHRQRVGREFGIDRLMTDLNELYRRLLANTGHGPITEKSPAGG